MTRQVYLDELDKLHKKVVEMGTLIEESLDQVEEALYKMNREKAREIIAGDDRVDAMEREIERACIDMIATQQPVATDLRRVTSIMRIISDLERIADHCSDISEYILLLSDEKEIPMPDCVPDMIRSVKDMIHRTVEAFVSDDKAEAEQVEASDDIVDDYFVKIRDEIAIAMKHNPDRIKQYIDYLMIIKYLERMADHSTNIAGWITFVVTGELDTLK